MSTATLASPTNRQPKGIPVGGQFAASAKGEAAITLDPVLDAAPQEDVPEVPRAYADAPEVFTRKYDKIGDKVDAFKAELDTAVEALATDENWLEYLRTQSMFHRYSFNNTMLIHLQTGGRATRVAGFRVWQDKFERTVNKGEKAIGILAPKTAWVPKKDPQTGEVVKKNGKVVKEKRVVGWTTASVFDIAQTDGKPLPTIEQELTTDAPDGFVDDMVAAAKEAGYTVEFRNLDSHAKRGPQGWTNPKSNEIVIDADLTPGSQAATLAHELGHVYAGHCEPENDGKYHVGDGGCRGRWEVEAESVAFVLGRSQGMDMQDGKLSAQYVAGWSKHDKDALRESATTIAKATKAILESTNFRNTVD